MMFEFDTIEQQDLRNSVAKIATKCIPPYVEKGKEESLRPLFNDLAAAGLTAISIDEEYGGTDLPPTTQVLVVEELATVNLGPAIFVSVHNMVSGLINRFGSQRQKERYLSQLASGTSLGAFALSESQAGSDAAALKTTAQEQGEKFILNGSKCWITSAGYADLYIVFAKTAPKKGKDGISSFIIPADSKGLSFGSPEKKMGCELSPIATVELDNVIADNTQLLGTQNDGYKIALSALTGGRINIAAAANGISKDALERCRLHLEERKQFGQALIEFQGLQFMLADMITLYESARMLTWRAARALEQENRDGAARLHGPIAKCAATDAAMKITTDAVQLLGGAGYVKEYKVEQLMRDAKMLQIVEGTNQIQRMVITKEWRNL